VSMYTRTAAFNGKRYMSRCVNELTLHGSIW